MSTITSATQLAELWEKTYNYSKTPDWSFLLPYYAEEITFRDSVQELHGLTEFKEMIVRLAGRSQDLKMKIINAVMNDSVVFLEWEMSIVFKKRPRSIIYGSTRIALNSEGKIVNQRDYYDLWGDIFDNIPVWGKTYRKFMKKKFG